MKVLEGGFGKPTETRVKASDVLQATCDDVVLEEDEGGELEVAIVLFKEGEYLTVLGNTLSVDAAYTLLQMGSAEIMAGIMQDGQR